MSLVIGILVDDRIVVLWNIQLRWSKQRIERSI